MTASELLGLVVAALDDAGIPHMVAGSFASSFHGEPRSTQDIDVVIDPDPESLATFVAAFDAPRFYVDDAQAALRNRSMFNLIDTETGWKVDLIIKRDRAFSDEELRRRQPVELLGAATAIATPEDTILTKLEWAAAGSSDRQLADVVAMLEAGGDDLDTAYLDRWADDLGVTELLMQARQAAAG